MIISGINLKLQYCIDFDNGAKFKTFNKSEYNKVLHKQSKDIKNSYVKLMEV